MSNEPTQNEPTPRAKFLDAMRRIVSVPKAEYLRREKEASLAYSRRLPMTPSAPSTYIARVMAPSGGLGIAAKTARLVGLGFPPYQLKRESGQATANRHSPARNVNDTWNQMCRDRQAQEHLRSSLSSLNRLYAFFKAPLIRSGDKGNWKSRTPMAS